MVMSESEAREVAEELMKIRREELQSLDNIHNYLRGKQEPPLILDGSPEGVRKMKRMSRVNIMEIVVDSVAQALYVDGYRAEKEADNAPAWAVWQANKMDANQTAVHRAATTYGVSYVSVLPGDTAPVVRGYSPRFLTALYDDDDPDWPVYAWRVITGRRSRQYRLYDAEAVYSFDASGHVGADVADAADLVFTGASRHNAGVTPIVRFLNQRDLDDDYQGEVEQLIPLQDQIDFTTYSLLVAQHTGAFPQRYVVGWVADSEAEQLRASAARIWAFEDSPDDIKVGEFGQTDLKGYLDSREATLRHAASLSQTPVHELIGQMVNLSAEALVAAEAGHQRKLLERQVSLGESWEQVLSLAGRIGGYETTDMAQVRWRDTESRALSATVDALGKMAEMLHIPPQELWERIPGVSAQDVERWKAAWESGDALTNLSMMLERQSLEGAA